MCTHYSIKTKDGKYVSFLWNDYYSMYDLQTHDNLDYMIKGLIFEDKESAFFEIISYIHDDYNYDWVDFSYDNIDGKVEMYLVELKVNIEEVKVFEL